MNSMEPDTPFNDAIDGDFADSLRDGLSQLARQAPGGPTGDQVLTALRRRRVRRTRVTFISGSLAAALAVVIVLSHGADNHESSTVTPPIVTGIGETGADDNTALRDVATAHGETTAAASQPAALLPSMAWGIAALDPSIAAADDAPAQSDGRAWNVSLSLTLASPTDTEAMLPVMELSSPRW